MKDIKIGACDWGLPGNGLYATQIAAEVGLDALSLEDRTVRIRLSADAAGNAEDLPERAAEVRHRVLRDRAQ